MVTPLAALGGGAVITSFTQLCPLKSMAWPRVRALFPVTLTALVQVPSRPSAESFETST